MVAVITRVFMNGNSQAVRIPHEFRLDAHRVEISRNEDGDLVLRAMPADRGAAFLQALEAFAGPAGDEFVAALERDRLEQTLPQERGDL